MSLSSLRGAAGLATTALDTARSTFKAMADAAVNPDAPGTPTDVAAEEQPKTGTIRKGRRGTVLDAYA